MKKILLSVFLLSLQRKKENNNQTITNNNEKDIHSNVIIDYPACS